MRFVLNQPWVIGAVTVPQGTMIDTNNPADPWREVVAGKPIPLCATSLDYSAALQAWLTYKHCRKRLQRRLGQWDEETYQQLIHDEAVLDVFWRGKRRQAPTRPKPKSDFAAALNAQLTRQQQQQPQPIGEHQQMETTNVT